MSKKKCFTCYPVIEEGVYPFVKRYVAAEDMFEAVKKALDKYARYWAGVLGGNVGVFCRESTLNEAMEAILRGEVKERVELPLKGPWAKGFKSSEKFVRPSRWIV